MPTGFVEMPMTDNFPIIFFILNAVLIFKNGIGLAGQGLRQIRILPFET